MWFKQSFMRLVAAALVGLLLNSCYSFKPVRTTKDNLAGVEDRYLQIIKLGSKTSDLYMSEPVVTDSTVTGRVKRYTEFKPYNKKRQVVRLYMNADFKLPQDLPQTVSLPIEEISRLEVYDFDLAKTIAFSVFGGLVGAALAYGVVMLIVLLTKGTSCPFIYAFDGADYRFAGEIYSGAILPSLERHDWLPLPQLQPADGSYKIRITNEVREIQSTNLAGLEVVDHPLGTQVLLDKYGNCHTLRNLRKPLKAWSQGVPDLLPQLAEKDSLRYLGDAVTSKKQSRDELFLSFARPPDARQAKLVLAGKNTIWLDYTMAQFFDKFGDKYQQWYEKQKQAPPSGRANWSLQQGIPLSVYVRKGKKWEFADYFNLPGPMADREMVLQLDLSGLQGDTINLKLEWGTLFWDLDRVGLDCSANEILQRQTLAPAAASDEKGRDIKAALTADDKDYYVMPETGNAAELTFAAVPARADCNRSFFLHAKGHYEVLRETSGAPDLAYLEKFRRAGRMGQFSSEQFLQLQKQIKRQD